MAKKSKQPRIAKKDQPPMAMPENIVLNEIIIRPIDRSKKDIGNWRDAHIAGERVWHANRSRLYDLYSDVLLDGHLRGIIDKRFDTVINKVIRFTKNGKKVDAMDELIESDAFERTARLILEKKSHGQSGIEFIPGEKMTINEINRKHIKPDLGLITYEQNGETGYVYEECDNVWVIGDRHDLGFLLECAPYALWKRGVMADWAQYVEIFGQPIRKITYDAYDLKTKMELKQVLDESGSSLAIMVPKQAGFEIIDGKQTNANGDLQDKLKDACNHEMSVRVLGNTETTTSSKSSGYAQSKEHGKQQHEVTKSDVKFLLRQLNSDKFRSILKSYGYPAEGGKFEIEQEVDLDDLTARQAIDMFVSQKVPIGDDYYYETYGIPKPDNYDELKKKMEDEKAIELQGILPNKPDEEAKPGKDKLPGDKKPTKPLKNLRSPWMQLRHALADFFDPALRKQYGMYGMVWWAYTVRNARIVAASGCRTFRTAAAPLMPSWTRWPNECTGTRSHGEALIPHFTGRLLMSC